jgi:predicted MFS family arabinose efflux permease
LKNNTLLSGSLLALLAEFRALDRRVWILTAARVVVTFGFSMVMPLLAVTLAQQHNVAAAAVGLIWTVSGAAGIASQWLGGSLADRWGRRPLILSGMAARAIVLVLLGVAIERNQPVFVIGMLVVANSILRSFFDPVASAMVADVSTAEQRAAAFSLQRIGVNIGWSGGQAVSFVTLAAGGNYAHLFYWSAPIALLAMLPIARIPETRAAVSGAEAARTRFRDLFRIPADPAFLRFLVATVVFFLLQGQMYQTLSIFAARALHATKWQIASLYFENGVLVVALQVPAYYFIRRIGTDRALVVGSLLYAMAYSTLFLAAGHSGLLLSVAAITVAEMVSAPAQQTTATSMAPLGRIGAYAGLYGLAQVAGQSLGPLVGGALFDKLGDGRIWLILPLAGVLAAVGYAGLPKLVSGQGRLGRANR